MQPDLRAWQRDALSAWTLAGHHGIVSVVTGGGKTIFALSCIAQLRPLTTLITVPTKSLLDQWWEEIAAFFGLDLDEIQVMSGATRMKVGTINIAVLNTAAMLQAKGHAKECFLIVDECHKAASPVFRQIFDIPTLATLGLSATPEREYDDGLSDVLIPKLGQVVFRYDYADALRDKVIVPFELRNIVFELESECRHDYEKLTKAIARAINQYGIEDEQSVALMLRRSRVLNASINRLKATLTIVARHPDESILIFHEDINACDIICQFLIDVGIDATVYHSRLTLRARADALRDYRSGIKRVLVTCRALDEGFNVPDTRVGIIAASTATRRQRIQRLGRVLRPSLNKSSAIVYTVVATEPEIRRLMEEEEVLKGVADTSWSQI